MTYVNQGKSTLTYEQEDGNFYSYDNNGNWSNTYEYENSNFSTFESNGNWSKQVIQCLGSIYVNGGEGGIRNHGTLAHSTILRPELFDHSADFTVLLQP